jgi:hypothetical protein
MEKKRIRYLKKEDIYNYIDTEDGLEFLKIWMNSAKDTLSSYKSLLLRLNDQILELNRNILKKSILDKNREYLLQKRQELEKKINIIRKYTFGLQEKVNLIEKLSKGRISIKLFLKKETSRVSKPIRVIELLGIVFSVFLFSLMINYFRVLSKANTVITGQATYPFQRYFFVNIILGVLVLSFLIFAFTRKE